MSTDVAPDAFAVGRVLSVELIDGGRTLGVRLEKADETLAELLFSQSTAGDLLRKMTELHDSANET